MRLYLVRHPPPDVPSGVCYGASDVRCTPEAIQRGAEKVMAHLPRGLPLICSPLQRCEQLAQALCGLEPDLAYQTEPGLREMDFGNWELRPWAVLAPGQLQAWTDDFAHYRCGQYGESTGAFIARVAASLRSSLGKGQDQVWITHAGVIRALHWLAAQPEHIRDGWLACSDQQPVPQPWLAGLRAVDWPQIVVPWSQVLIWDWPPVADSPQE